MLRRICFIICTSAISLGGICYFSFILLSKFNFPLQNIILPWNITLVLFIGSIFRLIAYIMLHVETDGKLQIDIITMYLVLKAIIIIKTCIITAILFLTINQECKEATTKNIIKYNCQRQIATLEGICMFMIAIDVSVWICVNIFIKYGKCLNRNRSC